MAAFGAVANIDFEWCRYGCFELYASTLASAVHDEVFLLKDEDG